MCVHISHTLTVANNFKISFPIIVQAIKALFLLRVFPSLLYLCILATHISLELLSSHITTHAAVPPVLHSLPPL